MTLRHRVVVVGAGAAGLTAARHLRDTHDVVVIDKGRGVGGRMATRRIGDATFDHGAQFLTTHHEDFATRVQRWCDVGVAQPWYRGQVGPAGGGAQDGHTRYRGTVSMNAIAKHLAEGLDVRCATRAAAVGVRDGRWWVQLHDRAAGGGSAEGRPGDGLEADALVLTAPVPQSLELLDAGGAALAPQDAAAMAAIDYHRCLAALVPLDGPSGLPSPGAVSPGRGSIDWIADNEMKGISTGAGITIHAAASFSAVWWDRPDEEIVDALLGEARSVADLVAAPVGASQVQRWRYARPVDVHPEPCLVAGGLPPLVLCGDAFGEAKVEGAVRSGAAAAAAIRSWSPR